MINALINIIITSNKENVQNVITNVKNVMVKHKINALSAQIIFFYLSIHAILLVQKNTSKTQITKLVNVYYSII